MTALPNEQWAQEEARWLSSFIHYADSAIAHPAWMPVRKGEHDAYPQWQEELIVRESFTTADGRIVGTEWVIYRRFEGRDRGYKYEARSTSTHHFGHRDVIADRRAASQWHDDLHNARSLTRVQGGTTRKWIEYLVAKRELRGLDCLPPAVPVVPLLGYL